MKEQLWRAYKQAWNEKGSMDHMTTLEIKTAKRAFEDWYQTNYGDANE